MKEFIPRDSQDVVIAGAGVAGLTAAIASSEFKAGVTVIDKAPDIKLTNTSLAGGDTGHYRIYRDLL